MHIHGFVLGVVLLAAVGWCMVQESVKQTQARYELAELQRREDETRQRLERLRAEEQELRSPARLAALLRDKKMDLAALNTAMPSPSRNQPAGEEYDDQDLPVDMAIANQW